MQVTEEMYLAVVRGLLEAEELLPQTRQTRPAVRRMHRALREAEELFLSALVFSEEKLKKPALIYEILD